ncbi:dipeptide epimerase [Nisaea acidiphila]|uniref:Dipeptide epimerase n=1 Tax=Nisaea acidiphila TaxID=1862145 RepID=A0A9J7AY61_9PROT|nr:N-acetyl-D-Glu racemase DgcA [Nisaea acidiphila]UUX51204.1 dipeptide epimerase [Nisaea acidiphila]
MYRSVSVRRESWPLQGVFRISRGARTESHVIVVEIAGDDVDGLGECFPYARYGETLDSVVAQIESVAGEIANGMDREGLLSALPPGAARNAIDCALWDFEAKKTGKRAWELAGLPEPEPVTTVYTLGVDEPEAMGAKAKENASRPVLKLKMTGDGKDLERVTLIHENAPNAKLVVDANEGWTVEQYNEYAPKFARLGVTMIEQPLPAGKDEGLKGLDRVVPVCADESCHDSKTLDELVGKYDMINIKLDKTGGLTEALKLRDRALAMGFEVMVGCMVGTSLAMAPGVVVAQGAAVVDLDGPLLLAKDRDPGLVFNGSIIQPPEFGLWG